MEVAAQQNTLCPAKPFCPATTFYGSVTLPFVIPSEAEGSAVLRTSPGNVLEAPIARQAFQDRVPRCSRSAAKHPAPAVGPRDVEFRESSPALSPLAEKDSFHMPA